jgi:hypothetical protein
MWTFSEIGSPVKKRRDISLSMNEFFDHFKGLSSIAILGGRRSGKLTFALYFASQLTQKPIVLISPFSQRYFNDEWKTDALLSSTLGPTLKNIKTHDFRDDWNILEKNHGYSFLLKYIEKLINESHELIIIHRINEFFENQTAMEIENFLFSLLAIVQASEKIVIFTVDIKNKNTAYIHDFFKHNIDSEFAISSISNKTKARTIELVFSILATQHEQFSFELNSSTQQFKLIPKDALPKVVNKQYPRIILASQSPKLERITRYLFEKNQYEFIQIEPYLTEVIQALSDDPQLIIFNPSIYLSPTDLTTIGALLKSSSTRVIFISPNPTLRRRDKEDIRSKGFPVVQEGDFYIEDFIYSLEHALDHPFYSTELKKIPNRTYVVYEPTKFNQFIVSFLCKGLFFTIFKFKTLSPIAEEDVKKNLARAFDVAYINKDKHLIYLFLVNTSSKNSASIESKFSAISPEIQLIGYEDATTFSLNKNNISLF